MDISINDIIKYKCSGGWSQGRVANIDQSRGTVQIRTLKGEIVHRKISKVIKVTHAG